MKKMICELHDEMIPKRPKPPKSAKCGTCAHYHETRPEWHDGQCDLYIMDGLPAAASTACYRYEKAEPNATNAANPAANPAVNQ